jgi:SAM-dependent methyltransferase
VSFNVTAEAYGRFMGRFSEPLAAQFIDVVSPAPGQRVLDVGCGPGALTAQLVARLGAQHVTAVDPSPSFVEAARERFPDVDVQLAAAEDLRFADETFDAAMAQLVVHFMKDPVAGLREMGRVVRPDGVVAACVWDHAGGAGPISVFWDAVHYIDPLEGGEARYAGAHQGDLASLCAEAGLSRVEESVLTVDVDFPSFEDWWEPFTLGVGPAGAYVDSLDELGVEALRAECERRMPPGSFSVSASAWCVTARPS